MFNGAIYNFRELREELRAVGYVFHSQTDTEVILAAFDRWGKACFDRFVGMWALAIYTPATGALLLCRDRFGIKPLYYSEWQGFSFASETRALRETLHPRPRPNLTVAAEFINYGWQDHRPDSLYEGISQLPAGHLLEVSRMPALTVGKPTCYYRLSQRVAQTEVPQSRLAAAQHLRRLLSESVRLRTRSDVGFALTLSGGIDSSAIAGIVGGEAGLAPATFSALFPGTPYDESTYVAAVNQRWKLPGHPYLPSYEDFLADVESCQYYQDQPLSSIAVVTHFSLMRRIGEAGERVILNGQGADEILAGYDKFYLARLRELKQQGRGIGILRLLYNYGRHHRLQPTKVWGKALTYLRPQHKQAMLGPYFDNLEAPFVRASDGDIRSTSMNLIGEVGLPVLLRHEDRNTMAFGLESRVSFLDHRLVEFALAVPAVWKIRRGVRKSLLREACDDLLPPVVRQRYDKLGFATPQYEWMERDAPRYLEAARQGEQAGYFSTTARRRCELALRERRRGDYAFVFRCWAWMQFVAGAP